MARSQCSSCSETFSSESAFNMHRTGSYGQATYDVKSITHYKHERSCMTEDEMLAKKMVKNEKNIWTTGAFDADLVETFARGT